MDEYVSNQSTNTNCSQFPKYSLFQYSIFVTIVGVSLMLGESMFAPGHAQTTLGQRTGQSALQSATGNAIFSPTSTGVCPGLVGLGTGVSAAEADLRTQCGALVHTGNALNGTGVTTLSLGLGNEELNAALQQMASEELLAPRTQATKTFNGQQRNLSGRLAALRGGSTGLSIASLNLNGVNPLAGLSPQALGFSGVPQRGGGASGDLGSGGFSRLGAFVSGSIGTGKKDESSKEDGFDFDTAGITVGVDYRLLDELVLGTAFSYSHFDSDFDTSSVNAGGGNDSDGYTFSIYSTYYIEDFYLEAIGSAGWSDHDSKRKIFVSSNTAVAGIDRTAKGETDSTQYSFSVGTGYNAQIGSVDFGPFARLTYLKLDIDGFKESGASGLNLEVEDQDITSLISAVGLQASKKFSWQWGVWFPQIRGEWDHEFENDAKTTTTKYVNDPFNTPLFVRSENPDRNFYRVGATLANVSAGGTQVFFDYETFLGLQDISNHIFTIGARLEF